jgi:hypothetical protein
MHHHRIAVPLRADVLALVGISISFLVPPLYLSLRHSSVYTDPWELSAFQPQVALLAGAGGFFLLLTFRGVHRRLGGTDESSIGAPAPLPMSRALPALMAVGGVIVAARLYLLASGAYYWTYAEEGFLFGRWYSVTNNLSRYGLIVPILLWVLGAQDRRWRVWALLATALELAWVLPSGARQALLETAFGLLLVAWWRNGKLPRGRIVVVLAAATMSMPIIGEYRYTISRYSGTQEVSFDATVRALWDARDRLGFEGGLVLTDRFVQRLYDGQYFGYLLKHYRQAYDFEYGATYFERLPYVVVPYFVANDRATMQVPLDRWFKLNRAGSNPSTLFGEAYANFGYLGIPLAGMVLGAALACYEAVFRRLRDNVFVVGVYLLHGSMLPFQLTQSLATCLSFLRNAVLMMLAMEVLVRMSRGLGVRGSRPGSPALAPR